MTKIKLFNLVLPDLAVFGAKDYQQAAVIRRMVRDLNFPVRIVIAPTVRERDGVAMSSRNRYLIGEQRIQARALVQAIREVRLWVKGKEGGLPVCTLKRRVRQWIEGHSETRLDYVEFFDPETLEPVGKARSGVRMGLAVWVGKTRLIDNGKI